MAGHFLDELTGDFVKYLRADATISGLVGSNNDARIFPEAAKQGSSLPYVVYTRAGGHSLKNHAGIDPTEELTVHVYAFADSASGANALGVAIRDRMLSAGNGANTTAGDGTTILVCNGGLVDSGYDPAKDSSDRNRFWVRVVLSMLIEE